MRLLQILAKIIIHHLLHIRVCIEADHITDLTEWELSPTLQRVRERDPSIIGYDSYWYME